MPVQMYNTGIVHTARNPVIMSQKFTVNLATGAVTVVAGKRVSITAGVGTGVITMALPQIFSYVECIDPTVLDPTLSGAVLVLTQGETTVNNRTTLQFTIAKGATPAAITTGTYTCYISMIGVCQ